MSSSLFMGLDFGTQGVRCGIYDQYGEVKATSEANYDTVFPEAGWAEQTPNDWIAAMGDAVTMCYAQTGNEIFSQIKALSVCCTSSTVIPMDENDHPLTKAIIWMDNRAKSQAVKINDTQHKILKYCGKEESVEWFIPKLLWIKENQNDVYKKAKRIVELQDYINHYLTGRWCASISQATCKGNYVEELGGFSEDFLASAGLPEYKEKINLDVIKQGEVVGKIRESVADNYKLPPEMTVYQGGIDAHTSMIGLGVCKPGDMGAVMGTSFVHLAVVDKPIFKEGIWGPYKDAIIPDLFCMEGGQVSAGSITKWFLDEFDIKGSSPYQVMENEAGKIPIGSEGLVLLDYFQGNRTPYKDPMAKGVIYGLTLRHSKAHIYRAILEGIAFGMRNIIDNMETSDFSIDVIRGCGGVTKNPLWLQIISDVTGKPIMLTKHSSNSGVLGCAIVGAVGSRLYHNFEEAVDAMVQCTDTIVPDKNAHSAYNANYKKYLKLYDYLKELMSE